ERSGHSSILIDRKLYFSGGNKIITSSTNYSDSSAVSLLKIEIINEFFYLDVSEQFTLTDNVSIPWIDITYTGGPQKYLATACIGKQKWTDITSVGSVPADRYYISCANVNNGLITIFTMQHMHLHLGTITLPDENIVLLPLYNTKSDTWTNM
ncbi:8710_t:CDS:2, partial [Gigaspora margarita]